MQNYIIDSHSHLGMGYKSKYATINQYLELKEKYNISFSLFMPQPILMPDVNRTPELFDEINISMLEELSTSILGESSTFVPMVSPIYMSAKKIEEYIELFNPVAFKIHFRSDYSYPKIIPKDWISVITKYDIPLIVHTDYSPDDKTRKQQLKNLNSSLEWFDFFLKNGVKGYLTHGARLNRNVLEQINYVENIVIGLGPDLMLQSGKDMLEQESDYLYTLYNYVDPNKIVFDVDFNWNLDEMGNLEYNSIKRLSSYWSDEELENILFRNSANFFQLEKKLVKKG